MKMFQEKEENIIEKKISKQIKLDTKLFLLAIHPEKHNYSKSECTFIDLSLLSTKKMYGM